MPTEITIPPFGESIKVVYLAEWKKNTGDYVEADEVICEIETDKASQELPSEVAGVLTTQVNEGDEVPVGAVIATVDESAPGNAAAAPAKPEPADTGEPEPAPAPAAAEAPTPEPAPPSTPQAEPVLSPAAQFHAAKEDIDPSAIEGTGRGGRILKEDVLAVARPAEGAPAVSPDPDPAPAPTPSPTPASQAPAPTDGQPDTTRKRMSMMRRTIANRLVSVQHEAAILTTFNEADMSEVIRLRKAHQEAFVKKHDVKLGFMSFFVRAVVRALKTVPAVNAQIDGADIVQHHRYHIGVAISTERGLVVPVLRNADQMTLAQIEQAIIVHANRARAGQISLSDLEGGCFSITNGGIFGSMLSTPILNPPQSGILGMHAIQQRPVAVDGQVAIRPMMYLALSYDHRIVDGREAVTFLVKVKQFIENPLVELLDL